jgi:hypothetical protein
MEGTAMRNSSLVILACCLAFMVGGCSGLEGSAFRSDGIPQDKYLVGGGWQIDFTAPSNGTAYLVEMNYRKLLETKSLDEGESYRQNIDPGESQLKDIGIDSSSARLALFFVPARPCQPEHCEK